MSSLFSPFVRARDPSEPVDGPPASLLVARSFAPAASDPLPGLERGQLRPLASAVGVATNAPTRPLPVPQPGDERRLGELLVDRGVIDGEKAQRVLEEQARTGQLFGEAAIALGFVQEMDIRRALSDQFSLPRVDVGQTTLDRELVAAYEPDHPAAGHLRELRSRVLLRCGELSRRPTAIAVVGLDHGSGRTHLCANLAISFAQLGKRTLIIDADLIAPRVHRLFGIESRRGLSTILAGRGVVAAVPIDAIPGLAVLPAGPLPPNPHDLLARPLLRSVLEVEARNHEVVLVDTPAWVAGAGTRMAAAAGGAGIVVVRGQKSSARSTRQMTRELSAAGVDLLGVVFNDA